MRFTLALLADPIAAQVAGPFGAIQHSLKFVDRAWTDADHSLTLGGLRRNSGDGFTAGVTVTVLPSRTPSSKARARIN